MIAADVMSENPRTVEETSPISEVVDVFLTQDIRHLPVIRGGELVGIVSDRDLRQLMSPIRVFEQGLEEVKSRWDEPVSQHMNPDVVRVDPDTELSEVIDRMLDSRVGAIPVADASTGDLVGIVSYVDILRALRDSA